MGWERKRGKLEEFNRLLRDAGDTGFTVRLGDLSILPSVRYVLTLDADSRLPRGAAQTLIGILSHPLNRPVFDPSVGRVTEGYGILQPRVSVTLASAAGSLFARVYAGHTGVDPYTTAVSDTYQDLFGEGIFTGKGLYDVDAFRAAVDGRVPENALLSHDLFEGLHARTGARLRRGGGGRLSRRTSSRTRAASTAGCAATGRSSPGFFPWSRRRRASRRTACRSSASGRSSTTCGGASWRPPSSLSSRPPGRSCPGTRSRGPWPDSRSCRFPLVTSLFHLLEAAARVRAGPRPPARPSRGAEHGLRAGVPDARLPPVPRLGDGACHRPDAREARHHAAPPAGLGDRRRAGRAGRGPAARGSPLVPRGDGREPDRRRRSRGSHRRGASRRSAPRPAVRALSGRSRLSWPTG